MNPLARTEDGWNLRPGDPTTVLGWIFRRRLLASSFNPWTFAVTAGGYAVVVAGIVAWRYSQGKPFDFSAFIMVFFFGASAASGAWKWRHPNADAHAALPTITDETDALPVILTISNAYGKTTGRDHGWVSFADGWLVYEGLRTTFSLTKDSIRHYQAVPNGADIKLSDGRRIQIAAIVDSATTALPARHDDAVGLSDRVRGWYLEPTAEGAAILPPRQDHPVVVVERLAFPPVYGVISLFLALMANWWGGMAFATPLLLAAAGCLLWSVYGLFRFWRDLPKLTR